MGFRKKVTIRRKVGGFVDIDGYWNEGQFGELQIIASVQPLNADEKAQYTKLNKDGESTYSLIKLYTDTPLVTEKQGAGEADIVIYDGKLWKVVMVEGWLSNVISHYKVICQEIDTDENGGEVNNEQEANT